MNLRHMRARGGKGHHMRILRSTMAVLVGFMSVAVLSLSTDQVLHVLEIYPP